MSTLLRLIKGNTTANAFPIRIDKNSLVCDLKKAIKAEKQNDFAGVDADRLKLWKVEILGDHLNPLKEYSCNSRTTRVDFYLLEIREKLASLQALLNKSVHAFDVIVSPKRTKGFKWTVNIDNATLEGLKEYIREMDKPPALE
ncbi:unnamed protein product [Rhizophagus irregularis]|nr:unnamed protein product [Rhizophagus irregularis]